MINKVDFKNLTPSDVSIILKVLSKEPDLQNRILLVEGQVIYKNKTIVGNSRKRCIQPMINIIRM